MASLRELMGSPAVVLNFMASVEDSANVVAYDPDGEIVTFQLSVGEGRSATVIRLPHDKIPEVCDVFAEFDPEAVDTREDRPLVDIIRSTLTVERETFEDSAAGKAVYDARVKAGEDPKKIKLEVPEDYNGKILSYNFKTSDKPHTREVRVPASEWMKFREYIATLPEVVSDKLIENFRKVQIDEERKAAEKLARKNQRETERSIPSTASASK